MPSTSALFPRILLGFLLRWAIPLVLLGAGAGWIFWVNRTPHVPATHATLAALLPALERGDPQAPDQARAIVLRDPAAARGDLTVMLHHPAWQVRAAACQLLSLLPGDEAIPVLIARASDDSAPVRAAAFDVLLARYPVAPHPARDLPMAQREEIVLALLDAHDRQGQSPLRPDLCELYADDQHVEFAALLVKECLTCHVGAAASDHPPAVSASACTECHKAVVDQWAGSAHAQSLTHLHLRTVSPVTRQGEAYDFGSLRGIDCMDCHRLAGTSSSQPAGRCRYTFTPGSAAAACATCHASTAAEWRTWLAGPQPRMADWPPGQLDVDHHGEVRSCADCHMPASFEADGLADHRWKARRDPAFLRSGIHVEMVSPAHSSGGVGGSAGSNSGAASSHVVLTNLAGHAYPTGSRRRSVALEVVADNGVTPVVWLSPLRPGLLTPATQPALAPGQQQTVTLDRLPVSPTAWQLTYFRDRADPAGYSAIIDRGPWRR